MGLTVHSLGELPVNVEREYYVYLLDYGWEEPLADSLYRNFPRMADIASRHDAVVLRGVVGSHFADEVLSWHHVNGRDAKDLLPAVMITTKHPYEFRDHMPERQQQAHRLLLIPLRGVCTSPEQVAPLLESIFQDIQEKRALSQFKAGERMTAGSDGALVDALILKPNFSGIGIDLNRIVEFFRGRRSG